MSVTNERRKLIAVIAVSAAAVILAAGGAVAIGWLSGSDETVASNEPPGDGSGGDDTLEETDHHSEDEDGMDGDLYRAGGDLLPEPMGGQEAIDALGEDLERVAAKNNRSVEELRDLLLRDHTVKVTPSGFLIYIDTATPNLPEPDE